MAARHFLNRGRSIRSSFGVSNIFAFNLLGGQFCKSTSHSNLLMLRSYATKSEAEKQNLKLGRIIKEGDRAYFHTTRWLSSPHVNISPCIERVDKMKLELRFTNTKGGFQIHYIVPVEIKGKRVVRLYNRDHHFVKDWLPYTELMVKNQPADLRAVMDRYWLSPDKETSHDTLRAALMLHYGVHNYLPISDNYWEETVKIALPFLEEDREHYLGKILEDFPREGVYGGKEFVKGLSRIVGKDVSVEFEEYYSGDTKAVGFMLLLDEEKRLINHPEHGTKCCRQFVF